MSLMPNGHRKKMLLGCFYFVIAIIRHHQADISQVIPHRFVYRERDNSRIIRMGESIGQQIMDNKFYLLFIHIKFQFLPNSHLTTEIYRINLQQFANLKKVTINYLFYRI